MHTRSGLQEENEGCLVKRPPQGIFVSPKQQDPCGPACHPFGLIAIPCQFSWPSVTRIRPSCGQKRERNKKGRDTRHRSRRRQRERERIQRRTDRKVKTGREMEKEKTVMYKKREDGGKR